MRMRIALFVAGLLITTPLAAQQAESAAAWLPGGYAASSLPVMDPRLRADFRPSTNPVDGIEARTRLSLTGWLMLGSAVGCVTGAVLVASDAEDEEKAPMRFQGCILGAALGGFVLGLTGLAAGA